MSDDDLWFFDYTPLPTCEVHEDERLVEETNLLGPNGRPILKLALRKPRIGFHPPDEDIALFDMDPDTDFIYVEE